MRCLAADGDGELVELGIDRQRHDQLVVRSVEDAVDCDQIHLARVHRHSHEVQNLTDTAGHSAEYIQVTALSGLY